MKMEMHKQLQATMWIKRWVKESKHKDTCDSIYISPKASKRIYSLRRQVMDTLGDGSDQKQLW